MKIYSDKVISEIRNLRSRGQTYRKINNTLELAIPKSTLSYICKNIEPGNGYRRRMKLSSEGRLVLARELAVKKNKEIFEAILQNIRLESGFAAKLIYNPQIAKIALAMLYLGEDSKWKSTRQLRLGNSDAKIIKIYMHLLKDCYGVKDKMFRCRIQH